MHDVSLHKTNNTGTKKLFADLVGKKIHRYNNPTSCDGKMA